MLELLIGAVLLSAVTYRVGRFLILDTLIEETRHRVFERLNAPDKISTFRLKLVELLSCPYCLTVWIAAAAAAYWGWAVDGFQWRFFPVLWLASAAGSLVFWARIDSED